MIKIAKFGGSSVASAEQFRKVKDIVESDPDRRFVVVSAAGKRFSGDNKITDLLLLVNAHIAYHVDCTALLKDIEQRLISRFSQGLSVAIEPPELEMRIAILLNKAKALGAALPEEVAMFIAKRLKSNVRELEGALQQVIAYQQFQPSAAKEITIDIAKHVLRDQFSVNNNLITIESIQKTVADYYNIKVAEMHSKRRPANIARPRQIAMYLTKELTQHSLPEIGANFGGRDHTTVMHAVRKITQERQGNAELNHEIHVLEQMIKG